MNLHGAKRLASLLLTAGIMLAGCGASNEAEPLPDDALMLLAVGDSILSWNDDRSIPAIVGRRLSEAGVATGVTNRAVSGSCLGDCPHDLPRIGSTFTAEDWDIVLIDGGANDVGADCDVIDELMTGDGGEGLMVDLLERAAADADLVVLYGYSHSLSEGRSFLGCRRIGELMDRYAAYAAQTPGVEFFDAQPVTASDPDHYSDDIHPSVAGSDVVGTAIAERLLGLLPTAAEVGDGADGRTNPTEAAQG